MISKQVELWLLTHCKTQSNVLDWCITDPVLPGELVWIIEQFNWNLLEDFFQTVKLSPSGDRLKLQLWNNCDCDDEIWTPLYTEEVLSNISIRELHIKLQDVARVESIKKLDIFLIGYYQDRLDAIHFEPSYSFFQQRILGNLTKAKIFVKGCMDVDIREIEKDLESDLDLLECRSL